MDASAVVTCGEQWVCRVRRICASVIASLALDRGSVLCDVAVCDEGAPASDQEKCSPRVLTHIPAD